MKRSTLCAVLVLLVLIPCVASADTMVTLLVDGKRMPTTPPPVLRAGRVYIPVTAFRPIGLAVSVRSRTYAWVAWPETDLFYDFKAGVRTYPDEHDPRGSTYTIPGTPFVSHGVLMVPLRAILSDKDEGTSIVARWDARARTVEVRRSRGWLRWRYQDDYAYVENSPDEYSHVFLGDYVPLIPSREIERAEKLDASGEWFDAAKVLHAVIWSKPFTWPTRDWDTGVSTEEWKAYEPLGRILIRERPEGANGHYYLGIGLAVNGDFDAAEQEFRRSAELDSKNADAYFGAGWAVLRADMDRALRADGPPRVERDPEAIRRALSYYDRALQADPRHILSLRASGYAWLSLAYTTTSRAGYSDEARAEVRPYVRNAVDHFERLLEAAGPSPGISCLLESIRNQAD